MIEQHAERARSLDGKRVTARPNGPMGASIDGVVDGYDDERSDPVVYVVDDHGTYIECWVWDVEEVPAPEARPAGELSAWERSTQATARIMAARGCDPNGYPLGGAR
jgi:hypothetical protein